MIDRIYDRFNTIVSKGYSPEEANRILGMLYVAMQEELGGDVPLDGDDGYGDFAKAEQLNLWTKAFIICNGYADAIKYLHTADLEQEDIEDGIKQVDQAQKDELFANFIIVPRTKPVTISKPQFMIKLFKEAGESGDRVVHIEISEKDTISMKLHTERYLKYILKRKGASEELIRDILDAKRVTVHLIKELPNYREFWLDRGEDITTVAGKEWKSTREKFLFGEYMDAIGHKEGDVFVRQYLFEERMTYKETKDTMKAILIAFWVGLCLGFIFAYMYLLKHFNIT